MLKIFAFTATFVACAALITAPSTAKIRCNGSFQIIPGVGPHASPYCEIKHLAHVARRSYGISTSFQRLRASDAERKKVCRAIGHDHRIYSICLDYRNQNQNKFWD